jgi:micrococcal nuclease
LGRLRLNTVGAWLVGALLLVSAAACSDTSVGTSSAATSPASSLGVGGGSLATPTATATPVPTPTPRPATPAPVQPAVPAAGVSFVNAPLSARHGQATTLIVKTSPNTGCSIQVVYKSGPSHAQGLVPKTSDRAGNVSWTWIVGSATTPGQWPIYVTCGSAREQTYISVT